jgi:hypothetical protein
VSQAARLARGRGSALSTRQGSFPCSKIKSIHLFSSCLHIGPHVEEWGERGLGAESNGSGCGVASVVVVVVVAEQLSQLHASRLIIGQRCV